ncbi:HNH endonuclease [Pseudanabaena sp. Chao 1811]|uniref:HNH endonuclease n=1 Tax=Pseudanabaena sp. Chao 1811 TaxID=2963092 RepID=UPI0022F3B901|nr:HNH endonuclease [Pseudanabaena sp. Chao 1811]
MSERRRWSRDELIIAMNLYCKLSFGQLHHRTPIIIEVSRKIDRTPSSLAMKLVNFASLDTSLQARGIKGLQGASKADREIWKEFNENWEVLGYESEEKFQLLFDSNITELESTQPQIFSQKLANKNTSISTESEATVKVRIGQKFFRETVISNYYGRCCITGNPIATLLVASHILPWSQYPEHRLNPHNGLCLSSTQDKAFDKGLITIDSNYQIILSSYIKDFLSEKTIKENFGVYRNQPIQMPEKFHPDQDFLKYHREKIFVG